MGHMETDTLNRIVNHAEVQQITNLKRVTLWRLEREGKFPRRRQLTPGGGRIGWLLSDVIEWVESRPVAALAAARK